MFSSQLSANKPLISQNHPILPNNSYHTYSSYHHLHTCYPHHTTPHITTSAWKARRGESAQQTKRSISLQCHHVKHQLTIKQALVFVAVHVTLFTSRLVTDTQTPADTPAHLILAHLQSASNDLLNESQVQLARQRGPELVKLCLLRKKITLKHPRGGRGGGGAHENTRKGLAACFV